MTNVHFVLSIGHYTINTPRVQGRSEHNLRKEKKKIPNNITFNVHKNKLN